MHLREADHALCAHAPLSALPPCSDKFTGRVVEVVSGDCLVVKDRASGVERRINLSSIRTPRMGTRDRQPEPYATEAKEFLRCDLGLSVSTVECGLMSRGQLQCAGDGNHIPCFEPCFAEVAWSTRIPCSCQVLASLGAWGLGGECCLSALASPEASLKGRNQGVAGLHTSSVQPVLRCRPFHLKCRASHAMPAPVCAAGSG
jgi:hypothetical protein